MIFLFRLLVVSLLLLSLTIITVLALSIESSPLVIEQTQLTQANIDRVKRILRQHQPGKLRAGETKTISISEKELNLLINHFSQRIGSMAAVLKIKDNLLRIRTSWDISRILPYKKLPRVFFNIETIIASSADGMGLNAFDIQSLKIGSVSFPPSVVEAVMKFGLNYFYNNSDLQDEAEVMQRFQILSRNLAITYQWKAGLTETIRGRFISEDERQSLAIYNQFLVSEVEKQGKGLSFTSLVEATFRYALERSQNSDPVAENRAAIMMLAAYANGRGLSALVPESVNWIKPRRAKLRIQGRYDLVRHFTVSAALAVAGGEAMSTAIGLHKEIDDANGGSGFSFKDLAADKAGGFLVNLRLDHPQQQGLYKTSWREGGAIQH